MVWYTGIAQKRLVNCLQVAQNKGLHKITGTFKMTPTNPLHNMTGIPPISYLLPKLMHAYIFRLQSMPPDALLYTVLTTNQCCYWPNYVTPLTNLCHTSAEVSLSTYQSIDLCTTGLWSHPHLIHSLSLASTTTRARPLTVT